MSIGLAGIWIKDKQVKLRRCSPNRLEHKARATFRHVTDHAIERAGMAIHLDTPCFQRAMAVRSALVFIFIWRR